MEKALWMPGCNPPITVQPIDGLVDALPHLKWLSLPERADGSEVFVRLSAFIDDIRIDQNRLRCTPYTFTTTYEEAMFCRARKTTVDPCDRFALPNNMPPKWMFIIEPAKDDTLRKGEVMPAFMKSGGGTEVFFENGTSDFTLIDVLRW